MVVLLEASFNLDGNRDGNRREPIIWPFCEPQPRPDAKVGAGTGREPHETLIAHIRRLLDTDFASNKLFETPSQFRARVQRVEDHLNSDASASSDGRGLEGLAKDLRWRCEEVIRR